VTSCTTVCTVVWQYLASIDAAILNPKYKILHPVRNFYAALTCLERNYPSVKHNNNNNNNNNNNKSTEHSPLWETSRFPASQEIPRSLWESLTIYHKPDEYSPHNPIVFPIHFNIVLPYLSGSSKCYLSWGFSTKILCAVTLWTSRFTRNFQPLFKLNYFSKQVPLFLLGYKLQLRTLKNFFLSRTFYFRLCLKEYIILWKGISSE